MKGKVLGIVIALLVVITGVAGYFAYQKVEEERVIADKIDEIKNSKNDFSKAEEHTEKLNVLKAVLDEQKIYNSSKKHSEEVSKEYEQTISDMQKVFKDEYDASIQEDTLNDIDNIDDTDTINASKAGLSKLLETIKEEKKYTLDSDKTYDEYKKNIDNLTKTYTDRIASLEEEKKKAAEEEKARQLAEEEEKKKEEAAKTHYENDYFSIDVPEDWAGYWDVIEEENIMYVNNTLYRLSYKPPVENYGGGAEIYIIDISNTSTPLAVYRSAIPDYAEEVGMVSFADYDVFMMEVGGGFFWDGGATITLK